MLHQNNKIMNTVEYSVISIHKKKKPNKQKNFARNLNEKWLRLSDILTGCYWKIERKMNTDEEKEKYTILLPAISLYFSSNAQSLVYISKKSFAQLKCPLKIMPLVVHACCEANATGRRRDSLQ